LCGWLSPLMLVDMAKEVHRTGFSQRYLWICVAVLTFTGITALISSHKLFYRGRVVIVVGKNGNPKILGISLASTNSQNHAFRALSWTGLKVCVIANKETSMNDLIRTTMSLDRSGVVWRQ
jgi:hypothetical protein